MRSLVHYDEPIEQAPPATAAPTWKASRRDYDLADLFRLAFDDLDAVARDDAIELTVVMRTRLIHWLARAYDAGRRRD